MLESVVTFFKWLLEIFKDGGGLGGDFKFITLSVDVEEGVEQACLLAELSLPLDGFRGAPRFLDDLVAGCSSLVPRRLLTALTILERLCEDIGCMCSSC